jgi:hypothetical protein
LTTVQESNAQFLKKLAAKVAGKSKKSKTNEKEKEVEKVEEIKVLNEFHQANQGKVVFFNKGIEYYKISSEDDSDANKITERVIAGDGPFSFRAYLGKPYETSSADENVVSVYYMYIKYTLGGVSFTTKQLRDLTFDPPTPLKRWYRMVTLDSYYDKNNYTIGGSLAAESGQYHDMYTLQEDAYRLLLSKVKDQLTKGASLTLKVEIMEDVSNTVLAAGEVTLKVTDASNNLQSKNCRCGKAGMTDEKVIKDVKEAFEFQHYNIKKAHKVVLLERDFSEVTDYNSKVTHKGMKASVIFERKDGVFMMHKCYVLYKANGSGFSDKATIQFKNNDFYLPVSPTCAIE